MLSETVIQLCHLLLATAIKTSNELHGNVVFYRKENVQSYEVQDLHIELIEIADCS